MRKDLFRGLGLAVLLPVLVLCFFRLSPAKAVGLDRHHVCIGLGCKPCESDRHGHVTPGPGCEQSEPSDPAVAPKGKSSDMPLQAKCRSLKSEEAGSQTLKTKCMKAGYPTPY